MGLACNINRRGRWARAICGAAFVAAAAGMMWSGRPASDALRWSLAVGFGLLGAFQVFEASMGWCVVRAMGRKTPI